MRTRERGNIPLRKTILIYCQGETERIYFEQMKILKRSKTIRVKIKNVKSSAIKLANHMHTAMRAINRLMKSGLFLIKTI